MSIRRVVAASLLLVVSAFSVYAQDGAGTVFGDSDQPGTRLHNNIIAKVDAGIRPSEATIEAIQSALTESDTTLDGESKSAVAFDVAIATSFYDEMINANSLIEVTKVLVESNPDKAVHVITLGSVLYPDFAQEVFDGAALTGVMSPEDILVAVLQAGVDPTTVSDATAAGPGAGPGAGTVPLGAGIGAGGTGGGDTTASNN
ncbi:hypothetical protein ACOI22_15630 [Glaciecola sp. 2405UD65-10]|uniref:hypothetical protein n=1 Tax=Glaciecola sp. 2405UD65-10 TaxID=3397244 RepID=UPI003B5B78CE